METAKVITPVWFLRTRSFWLGIFPAIVTMIDLMLEIFASEAAGPVGAAIATLLQVFGFEVTGDDVSTFMRGLAPVYALIIAHQRRGLNRPYVATAAKEAATSIVVSQKVAP